MSGFSARATTTRRLTTKSSMLNKLHKQRYLFAMMIPALAWVITMCYMPMYGLYMAFINYIPTGTPFFHALFKSEFVGLQWIKIFIFESGDFYKVMRNTLATSFLTILYSLPLPIIIAISLNEARGKLFKKSVQTISYLPYFISWVVVANIFLTMLSASGIVNELLIRFRIVNEEILFFQKGRFFWYIIAIANTWKSMGYNAIIYLAAIAGINPELYEAATVDGANILKKIRHITLPSIMPTVVVMLILSAGGILNAGFEQQFLMQNMLIMDYADVIDLYSYRYGIEQSMYSYGAAVGLFKSVVSFALLIIVNNISKSMDGAHIM